MASHKRSQRRSSSPDASPAADDTVAVALCFDDKFCYMAAGTIASLAANATARYRYTIYILHDDISPYNQYLLRQIVGRSNIDLQFITCNLGQAASRVTTYGNWSYHVQFRLFIHHLLPGLRRIVYLDADTVVCTDIAELYQEPLHGKALGAVHDGGDVFRGLPFLKATRITDPELSRYPSAYDYYIEYLGLNDQDLLTYFNSGVLVLDLPRAGPLFDRALPLLGQRRLYPNQDLLNLLFRQDKYLLDERYNVMPNRLEDYVVRHGRLPAIIHNTTPKPTRSMKGAAAGQYWHYLRCTGYYYQALEKYQDNRLELLLRQLRSSPRPAG